MDIPAARVAPGSAPRRKMARHEPGSARLATRARTMPPQMQTCTMEPREPRKAVGDISETYSGTRVEARPMPTPATKRPRTIAPKLDAEALKRGPASSGGAARKRAPRRPWADAKRPPMNEPAMAPKRTADTTRPCWAAPASPSAPAMAPRQPFTAAMW